MMQTLELGLCSTALHPIMCFAGRQLNVYDCVLGG